MINFLDYLNKNTPEYHLRIKFLDDVSTMGDELEKFLGKYKPKRNL